SSRSTSTEKKNSSDQKQAVLYFSCYTGADVVDEDIHLRPHAKFRKVDPGLDGKARPRNNLPFVMCLQIVHIGARAVNFSTNGMAGAMKEIFSVSRFADIVPRGIIYFETSERSLYCDGVLHSRDGSAPGPGHDSEYSLHRCR